MTLQLQKQRACRHRSAARPGDRGVSPWRGIWPRLLKRLATPRVITVVRASDRASESCSGFESERLASGWAPCAYFFRSWPSWLLTAAPGSRPGAVQVWNAKSHRFEPLAGEIVVPYAGLLVRQAPCGTIVALLPGQENLLPRVQQLLGVFEAALVEPAAANEAARPRGRSAA
jgi:hypothetical protein